MVSILKNLVLPASDAGANDAFRSDNAAMNNGESSALLSNNGNGSVNNNSTAGTGSIITNMESHSHGGNDHGLEGDISNSNGHHNNNNNKSTKSDADATKEKLDNDPVLRKLKMATALCFAFMIVEVMGGLWSGSLAVLSDAAHLTADLASFAVAIVAAYLAARPSTEKHTYGLKRTESLAALFSMTCLAMISFGLGVEAVRRMYSMLYIDHEKGDDEVVDGKLMSIIAAIGVCVNLALAAVLGEHHVHMPGGDHGHDHSHDHGSCGGGGGGGHGGEGHDHAAHGATSDEEAQPGLPLHVSEVTPSKKEIENVNLKAAYIHVMGDLAQSVAVLIAGLIIWHNPAWRIVDPIATILFCILVFWSTLGVIRSAICVLLEEVPPDVSWQRIHDQIDLLPGVTDVHDLHIWSISHGLTALSVHVNTTSGRVNTKQVLTTIAAICKKNGINHTTIQVQPFCRDDNGCITCGSSSAAQSCAISGEGENGRDETYKKVYCRSASRDVSSSGSTPETSAQVSLADNNNNNKQGCANGTGGCCG